MATVTLNIYDNFRLAQWKGNAPIDIENDLLKVMLVTSAYTPNQNTHVDKADLTGEVSGDNYTARGNTVSTPTVTLETSGSYNVIINGADPNTWNQHATGFTNARRAILYYDSTVDATSLLIGYSDDFGSDQGNVDGNFDVQFNASGIATQAR